MKFAFNRKSDSRLRIQFQRFLLVLPLIVLSFLSLFSWRFILEICILPFPYSHPDLCPGDCNSSPTGIGQIHSSTRWCRPTSSHYRLLSQQFFSYWHTRGVWLSTAFIFSCKNTCRGGLCFVVLAVVLCSWSGAFLAARSPSSFQF